MNDYIERNKALNELCLNHRDVIYIDKQEAAARIRAIPKEDVISINDIYRLIAGHSNYHGDSILSAFTCLVEGKEVKPIKPLDDMIKQKCGTWVTVDCYEAFGGDEVTWCAHGNPIAFHYCSNCKEQTWNDEFGKEILSDFCPNCGADMRGISND